MKINSNLPSLEKTLIYCPQNRCQINLKSSSNSFASKVDLRFDTIIQYESLEKFSRDLAEKNFDLGKNTPSLPVSGFTSYFALRFAN
jgi:hypothetical protein